VNDRMTLFSPCRKYRYTLWREWGTLPGDDDLFAPRKSGLRRGQYVQFIGLNPSTADETNDDPTIRRCINFAKDWGFGTLCMTNLFAFRATQPSDMMKEPEPVGPDNDTHLQLIAKKAGLVIAAWGTLGNHRGRADQVRSAIPNLHAIGLSREGFPRHPLYVAGHAIPQIYE